jgi:hypothetical protein
MTFHTALGFAPIQYLAMANGILAGYYLNGSQDRALVHRITPTGNVPLGECAVSFPHKNSVIEYLKGVNA